MSNRYITASIPYVNAKPHLGHLMEFIEADVLVRYYKLLGEEVRFVSGSDEHALKIVRKAQEAGQDVEQYCAVHAQNFQDLAQQSLVMFDAFLRTSSADHRRSSQELWKRCEKAGDIYTKEYTGMYCVGCEQFYTTEELDSNGECYEHPGKPLEEVSEKNYFFKLSRYKQSLIDLIESNTLRVIPESKKNEALGFLRGDVQDFSISRSMTRASGWGIPVPDDPDQVMYVWFDALNLYQTGVGFGTDQESYEKWWPADWHVIGKGISRFHTIYWPAILLSAGLKLPHTVAVHGYITVDGQKMSKTLGNVIDPGDLLVRYGADGVRYLLTGHLSTFEDSDISLKRFDELFVAHLSNGLGNLVSRVTAMASRLELSRSSSVNSSSPFEAEFKQKINAFLIQDAVLWIWNKVDALNKQMTEDRPWELGAEDQAKLLITYLNEIEIIATHLQPFLPESAAQILDSITGKIEKVQPLFPRLDVPEGRS